MSCFKTFSKFKVEKAVKEAEEFLRGPLSQQSQDCTPVSRIFEKIKEYANLRRTEARIFEFPFVDEVKFNDCFLLDLLSKTNLIDRLQNWLDEYHSEKDADGNNMRTFLIYFNRIGKRKNTKEDEKYGIFVKGI